ncbi:MAG: hypothetical protein WC998_04165 [Candidatus Paceibacterota bacterium]|jgi:hypothetical protein
MKKLSVKTTDCSYKKILNVATKCGFTAKDGTKHYKIKDKEGRTVTMVPRQNVLDRGTAKGILRKFNEFGANITIV